jgi:hypothetical protein
MATVMRRMTSRLSRSTFETTIRLLMDSFEYKTANVLKKAS